MSRLSGAAMGGIAAGVMVILSLMVLQGAAADTSSNKFSKRVYIELTEEFYQALKSDNLKRYSTNSSDEYLRQIAVSSRYMVESNLQILQRQERIIKLLEGMQNKNP